MMKTLIASAGLVLALGSAAAWADKAAADTCAAGLSPDAKTIYSASIGSISSGDVKSVVTAATKSLAEAGTIARGTARDSAMAAAQCLEMAQ